VYSIVVSIVIGIMAAVAGKEHLYKILVIGEFGVGKNVFRSWQLILCWKIILYINKEIN
jgi:hypothetical protein